MSDVAKMTLIVLWDPELRAAAAALQAFSAMSKDTDDATYAAVAEAALMACWVALHGITANPTAPMLVMSGEHMRFVPRETTIVKGAKT